MRTTHCGVAAPPVSNQRTLWAFHFPPKRLTYFKVKRPAKKPGGVVVVEVMTGVEIVLVQAHD